MNSESFPTVKEKDEILTTSIKITNQTYPVLFQKS